MELEVETSEALGGSEPADRASSRIGEQAGGHLQFT